MKRVSLLIAMLALVCGNAFAQFFYDFDQCPAGQKIAQTLGSPWTTWSDNPGSSEDGVFGAVNGNMAAYFTYGVDQVVNLGEKTTGSYNIDFDVYVEENSNGYFNLMHHFPCNSDQAVEVFIQAVNASSSVTISDGHGTVNAGGKQVADVPCRWNDWMHFRVYVDIDNDVAELYFDESFIYSWTWSKNASGTGNYSDRTLGGIDFYPTSSSSYFYVDNVSFEVISNDEVLIFDPFEEYTVGNHIATEAIAAGHSWWTTWGNQPGSSDDGVVASFDGTQCGHLTYGNDQVLLLGDEENGNYDLEFDILVPEGKNGYFNILHHFESGNNVYAMQCYLHLTNNGSTSTSAPGHGTIHAGSNGTADVTCVYDAWMHFRLNVDTDTDVARYYYTAPGEEEALVCEWQWSKDSYGNANVHDRRLAAMDFWPPLNAGTSEYYLDNVSFKKIGGESAPHVEVDPQSIEMTMPQDDMDMVGITINNVGNSIADWTGWIDFGQGEPGDQTAEVMLHNGQNGDQIGSNSSAFLREMGVTLRPSAYGGTAMGMQINSLKYFVNNSAHSSDGHYTFRLYEAGTNNQPGELLVETTLIDSVSSNRWIEGVFDQPVYLTGQVVWATVELMQDSAQFPMTMDSGHYGEIQDGNWLSTSGGAFGHCYSEGSFDGAWLITAVCSGTLVPGTWVTVDKTEGSILGGQSETLTLIFSSIAMPGGEYDANLILHTNEVEQPVLTVPLRLNVVVDDEVAECSDRISVYPNPASTTLVIKGENLRYAAIYNVTGQLVGIEQLGMVENHVNLKMGAGVYFFSIYDKDGNNTVQRVVVK